MLSDWKTRYPHKVVDGDRAVEMIKDGHRVYLSGNCSVPNVLLAALVRRAPKLRNVEIDQVLTVCPDDYVSPAMDGHLRVNTMAVRISPPASFPNCRSCTAKARSRWTLSCCMSARRIRTVS
jgi:acyl-CoA hydrolase